LSRLPEHVGDSPGYTWLCRRHRGRRRLRAEPLHYQPHGQDHLLHGNGETEHYLRAGQQGDGLEKDQQVGGETQYRAGETQADSQRGISCDR
jgi:hypothetical protein